MSGKAGDDGLEEKLDLVSSFKDLLVPLLWPDAFSRMVLRGGGWVKKYAFDTPKRGE
jgi:hypothetical protein